MNGNFYEGGWKKDKKDGIGTYIFLTTGEKFIGNFANGQRHGTGTFHFAYGDRYEGEWQRGKKHGLGKINYVSGSVYDGMW